RTWPGRVSTPGWNTASTRQPMTRAGPRLIVCPADDGVLQILYPDPLGTCGYSRSDRGDHPALLRSGVAGDRDRRHVYHPAASRLPRTRGRDPGSDGADVR